VIPALVGKWLRPSEQLAFRSALAVVIVSVGLVAVGAGSAVAVEQVLSPPSPMYRLGSFVYEPPTAAGWRQLSSSPSTLELVYVEMVSDKQINSRAHVVVEASKVPVGAHVDGPEALARLSRDQQAEARRGSLVKKSGVSRVPGDSGFYAYTIASKLKGVDLMELFYVLLSGDRSEYVVLKLATREPDYKKTPYYIDIYGSLASFRFRPTGGNPGDDTGPTVP